MAAQPKKKTLAQLNELETALAPIPRSLKVFEKWQHIVTLESGAQYADAVAALVYLRGLKDDAEKQRKALTGPLLAVKKQLDDRAKVLTEPVTRLEAAINTLVKRYIFQQEEAGRLAAEAEAAKAEAAGHTQYAEDLRALAVTQAAPPKVEGVNVRRIKKVQVESVSLVLRALADLAADAEFAAVIAEAIEPLLTKRLRAGFSPLPGTSYYEEATLQRR
jgi:hypothetical protein